MDSDVDEKQRRLIEAYVDGLTRAYNDMMERCCAACAAAGRPVELISRNQFSAMGNREQPTYLLGANNEKLAWIWLEEVQDADGHTSTIRMCMDAQPEIAALAGPQ